MLVQTIFGMIKIHSPNNLLGESQRVSLTIHEIDNK